jgi:nucleoside-diphosphate-sugar epimerase
MFEYDKIVYEADRPGEAQNTLCTDTLAKDLLGWQPRIELSDYIKSHQWKK